jgi:DNA-binding response OmpR family regulator
MEYHVLVIEDNPDLNNIFNKVLTKLGYRVTPVTTLANAAVMLAHLRFDLLVVDMRLPDGDGIDLLKANWSLIEGMQTKVIVVSAEDQYRDACEALGVEFFLEKPVSMATLTALAARLTGSPTRAASRLQPA